jgi:hypothetical protein
MKSGSERRKDKRMNQKGTIMVSDENAEYYVYAQIGNVSGNGMYFESEHALTPGRRIKIRYDNPPYKSLPKDYFATVQWCRPLSEKESMLSFGVGAKYL